MCPVDVVDYLCMFGKQETTVYFRTFASQTRSRSQNHLEQWGNLWITG